MRSAKGWSVDLQERRHRQKLILDLDGKRVELQIEVVMVANGPWHDGI